jgi:hypothetical protein
MNKKIVIISATAIILLLLGVGLYFSFKKPSAHPTGGIFPGSGQPVGGTMGTGTDGEVNVIINPDDKTNPQANRLHELHKAPVAGVSFAENSDHQQYARYIERGLGHIYETPLSTLIETRISNETHAELGEALWGNSGKSVLIRYVDTTNTGAIKTRILNMGGPTSSFEGASSGNTFVRVDQLFLPDFIPFIAPSEDGADKLFYLENSASSAFGSTVTWRGVSTANIFSSTFTEWLPQFPNQSLVTLTTRPSANIPGYSFFLNTKTRSVTKILSGINGLTTKTSRDVKPVLYAETKNGAPTLYAYDVTKKSLRTLSLQTFPEKCAWSAKHVTMVYCAVPETLPAAAYPDQWYQGLVSFSDSVWKIDTATGTTENIFTPPSLDIINPVLSSDDSYLLFMNKVTGTPWVYQLGETAGSVQN